MSSTETPGDGFDMDDAGLAKELGLSEDEVAAEMAVIRMVQRYGDDIRRMREGRGLSRPELAKKLGVTPARVAQLETGTLRNAVSLKTFARIAHVLGYVHQSQLVRAEHAERVAAIATAAATAEVKPVSGKLATMTGGKVRWEPLDMTRVAAWVGSGPAVAEAGAAMFAEPATGRRRGKTYATDVFHFETPEQVGEVVEDLVAQVIEGGSDGDVMLQVGFPEEGSVDDTV